MDLFPVCAVLIVSKKHLVLRLDKRHCINVVKNTPVPGKGGRDIPEPTPPFVSHTHTHTQSSVALLGHPGVELQTHSFEQKPIFTQTATSTQL